MGFAGVVLEGGEGGEEIESRKMGRKGERGEGKVKGGSTYPGEDFSELGSNSEDLSHALTGRLVSPIR